HAMKKFSHPGSKSREPADLNRAIENTVLVASNEWRYVAVVDTELDEDLPLAPCYAQDINQVLLNLIVNAAHAIEAKNGANQTDKGTITIATSYDKETVSIAVSDTGCGIKAEHLDRVFDPFFTTKDVGKGTGQGLSMAYRSIVDLHGGTLTATSEPGRGATFTVRLPLTDLPDDSLRAQGRAA
ncbi:MAG: ATP-binding protein, partial [Woeseia sp.]